MTKRHLYLYTPSHLPMVAYWQHAGYHNHACTYHLHLSYQQSGLHWVPAPPRSLLAPSNRNIAVVLSSPYLLHTSTSTTWRSSLAHDLLHRALFSKLQTEIIQYYCPLHASGIPPPRSVADLGKKTHTQSQAHMLPSLPTWRSAPWGGWACGL